MQGILVYRSLTKEEIKGIRDLQSEGAKLFYDTSFSVPSELQNIESESIQLSESLKDKISRNLIEKLLEFGDHEILGKMVKEHLLMQHTSIWYYHKFRIYYDLRAYRYKSEEIKAYANKFDQLLVYTSPFEGSIASNVQLVVKQSQKEKLNFSSLIKYGYLFFIRALKGWFQILELRPDQKHLIVANPRAESSYLSQRTLKTEQDDIFLGYLMQGVDKSFLFLDDLVPPKFRLASTFEIKQRYLSNAKNRPQLNTDYLILRGLFSLEVLRNVQNIRKHLKRTYEILEANVTSDDDHIMIVKRLKSLHRTSVYLSFKYFALQRFFKKHQFSTITAQDENNTSTKVIMDAAKSADIATIGVQHGTISNLYVSYRFTRSDREFHGFTDYFLAWGEHWKSNLVKYGNYNPDQVICTGQIRTDIIKKLAESSHNLDGSSARKTILFATQPQPDESLRKRAAEDAFTAVKEMKDVLLLLKLHPRETNPQYYHDIAQSMGCTNYEIDQNMDLYSRIATSDVVLTCYSTVGIESVYFNKPLIIIDHLAQDYSGYYREGVAFQATNAKELEDHITGVLSNKLKIDSAAYAGFISKYAYKIDGQVANRCLKFITSIS